MNDAAYEAQKTRILTLIDRWVKPLGLGWWHTTFIYLREPIPVTAEEAAANWQCLMRCRAKWEYMEAAITISLPAIEDLGDDDLEHHFLHELCHILVNEMRQTDENDWLKHEERVVTGLANAFVWLRTSITPGPPLEAASGEVGTARDA